MLNHPPSLSQYHSSGVDVYHDLSAHNQNWLKSLLTRTLLPHLQAM